jgi:ATP-dependent Clp protease ATP-binding subunit ClpC
LTTQLSLIAFVPMISAGDPCPPVAATGASVGQGHASADFFGALTEARALAAAEGRAASSLDVLRGVLRVGGGASRLLGERGLGAAKIDAVAAQVHCESTLDLSALEAESVGIAQRVGAVQATSLHLLLAVLREGGSGTQALRLAGHDPGKIRALVLRALTGPGPSGDRRTLRTPAAGLNVGSRQAPQGHSPGCVVAAPSPQERPKTPEPAPVERSPAASEDSAWELLPLESPRAPVLHREREVGRILDLLQAKTTRIIAVVGEPGSGRTALLSCLSAASAEKPLQPFGDMGAAPSPGALLQSLHRRAPLSSPIVLEGTAWLGPEGSDGPLQMLCTMNAGRRWIMTMTPADLRRIELGAPDLATCLETVAIPVCSPSTLMELVEAGLDTMAETTGVGFAPDVCTALVRLSPRYPSERAQPGRALGIAEVAAARAARLGKTMVNEAAVAEVVADAAAVPLVQLLRRDDERFANLEARLQERVVGHDEARTRIAAALRRSYAGFRGQRPLASCLLLGPTGVGKTETARAIAEALFDGESALVRIDLSEYSEPHAVARLIGSPPGYIGHENGGQLTEAIRRRPASVVLLDEIEKAHREVLLVLLQVLEDGRLTDGRGRTVDFSASAIVMTSNLGSECYRRSRTPAVSTIQALARSRLPPELWNRIDEVLCYAPLGEAELGQIVARIAAQSCQRLRAERGIAFEIDASVVTQVLQCEPDRSLGARPLRRAFERLVESPLANEIVAGRLRRGARLSLHCDAKGRLQVTTAL